MVIHSPFNIFKDIFPDKNVKSQLDYWK